MLITELIVCYLFLGGMGAGACFVLAFLGLLSPNHAVRAKPSLYQKMFVPGFAVALAALVLGMIFLMLDLGRPDRILLLLVNPAPTYITFGAWLLMTCVVLALSALFIWKNTVRACPTLLLTILHIGLMVVSFAVMTYTGLLLQSIVAVPLWTSVFVPVLFVLSSLSCGAMLVYVSTLVSGAYVYFSRTLKQLIAVDICVIAAELIVTGIFALVLMNTLRGLGPLDYTSLALSTSAQEMLRGSQAWLFWGGFVVVGLVVPLFIDVVVLLAERKGRQGDYPFMLRVLAVVTCVFVGGFVLRFSLVAAGMQPVAFLG